jgi:hypothetical protein
MFTGDAAGNGESADGETAVEVVLVATLAGVAFFAQPAKENKVNAKTVQYSIRVIRNKSIYIKLVIAHLANTMPAPFRMKPHSTPPQVGFQFFHHISAADE